MKKLDANDCSVVHLTSVFNDFVIFWADAYTTNCRYEFIVVNSQTTEKWKRKGVTKAETRKTQN